MRTAPWIAACVVVVLGCDRDVPEPVVRKAEAATKSSDDTNLRVLLAEMADTKACQKIRNTFQGLRGTQKADVVAGTLWIRACDIENEGTKLTVRISGDGWEWIEKKTEKVEATFAVHQYVRFHVDATLRGTLDFAYSPKTKVVTLRFAPTGQPEVKFEPIGNVTVDEQGVWSSIVGSIASAVSTSPSETAKQQVEKQGAQSFISNLDKGLTITVDACTGQVRSTFGLLPEGAMAKASAGKALNAPIELHRGGLLMFGPEKVGAKMNIVVNVSSGAAHLDVVCRAQADEIANAFLHGAPLPPVKSLVSRNITANARLPVKGHCPVVVIAQSQTPTAMFSWKREPAAAPGDALVECPKR
jgi:hypothetical protein